MLAMCASANPPETQGPCSGSALEDTLSGDVAETGMRSPLPKHPTRPRCQTLSAKALAGVFQLRRQADDDRRLKQIR